MYTIFQNGLLQYINTVWHDALIFYIKVICSTAMYQKNLAFVFCIFLSFSNRSRSMKNYASLEWDFEFHCTTRTHYSSSKRSSFVHFQFSTIFGSKPNVQTNIELVKFFIALNIHLCSSLNCPYELWRNLSTIQKIIKVHFNPISQSYIQKLDAFWKREPLH